jgi:hypothetical protein
MNRFVPIIAIGIACTLPDMALSQIYSVSLKLISEVELPIVPADIWIDNEKAYMVGTGGIAVANISDPSNVPVPLYNNQVSKNGFLIAVTGLYAYVGESGGTVGIINFKDIYRPKRESSIEAPGEITRIALAGGYLYLARKDFGLQVYEISIPTVPIFKGNQIVVGDANGLFVTNKYAYVTSTTGNLTIIDVTNLSNLPVAGNYNWGINFYDIFVDNKLAYIPQGTTGVQVIDISKLPTPEWVTNIYSNRFSRQVVVSGYYTVINDELSIQVFYNKDPKKQLYAGSFDNMGPVINRIHAFDNKFILICSNDRKLKILEMSSYY